MSDTSRVVLADRSAIGAARSATRRLRGVAGFDEQRLSEALIIATELATNVLSHAERGHFVVRAAPGAMTFVSWDQGPGIPDVERAFEDGFSTGGTQGTGLGAVRRLADAVTVRSRRASGTIVVADVGPRPVAHGAWSIDGLAVPLAGEGASGDAFGVRVDGAATTVVLADGLGHGDGAALAASEALACLREGPDRGPVELIEAMGTALRRTRGAAVAIARLEPEAERVRFVAIGNVTGLVSGPGSRRTMVNAHGIVGREQRGVREASYPLGPEDSLVLHTDGVRQEWDAGAAIEREDPLVTAAGIVRSCERGRDDVGVVVACGAAA